VFLSKLCGVCTNCFGSAFHGHFTLRPPIKKPSSITHSLSLYELLGLPMFLRLIRPVLPFHIYCSTKTFPFARNCSGSEHSLTCDESTSDSLLLLARIWSSREPQTSNNFLLRQTFCSLVKLRHVDGQQLHWLNCSSSTRRTDKWNWHRGVACRPRVTNACTFKLEFILRPTDSQPVHLGIGSLFGTLDRILSCSYFFVWQLLYSSF
jgi:hypothetical protein